MLLLLILGMWFRAPIAIPAVTRWAFVGFLALASLGLQPPAGGNAQGPPPRATATDAFAQPSTGRRTSVGEEPQRSPASSPRREGTQLEAVPGRVIEVGRRWAFITDKDQSTIRLLENLALERMARAIRLEPGDDHWAVSGTLTEFSGQNYLLLQVVTRASSSQAGSGDSTSTTEPSEAEVQKEKLARNIPLE